MIKLLNIVGARPQIIKSAAISRCIRSCFHDQIEDIIIHTGQHYDQNMSSVFFLELGIPEPMINLGIGSDTHARQTGEMIIGLEQVIQKIKPDIAVLYGDTNSTLAGSLAAVKLNLPVAHVEAGLRTGSKYNPFPEEINRHFLDVMADLCYAPTQSAKETLLAEGIPETRILVTGNTVVDALLVTAPQLHEFTVPALRQLDFRPPHRTLLVTAHRRESLGAPLRGICLALRDLVVLSEELQVVFPVHLNPKVREIVWPILGDMERVRLIEPVNYPDFVHLMKSVDLIMSDSGGVQEEAPTLGVPVLVIRDTTERPEGIDAGAARLVGTNREEIIATVLQLLDNPNEYRQMQRAINPYGDGNAAERIVDSIRHFFGLLVSLPMPFQAKLRQPNSIKI